MKDTSSGYSRERTRNKKKWLTEGHGTGLCLSMAAHASTLLHRAVLIEDAEIQTDNVTTTDVDIQTTPTSPTTIEMAMQIIVEPPSTHPNAAMSSLTMPSNMSTLPSMLPMLLTTVTTTPSSAAKWPPAPHVWQHSLPA